MTLRTFLVTFAASLLAMPSSLSAADRYVPIDRRVASGAHRRTAGGYDPAGTWPHLPGELFALPVKSGATFITIRTASPIPRCLRRGRGYLLQRPPCFRACSRRTPFRCSRPPPGPTIGGFSIWSSARTREVTAISSSSEAPGNHARVGPLRPRAPSSLYPRRPAPRPETGIALNAAGTVIRDSHISDCKAVGQDAQAIAGWNGPGAVLDREQLSRRSRGQLHAGRRRSGNSRPHPDRRDLPP